MIDSRKMVKDTRKSILEFLSEFPGFVNTDGGIVKNIAYEVKSGNFAGNGGGLDKER